MCRTIKQKVKFRSSPEKVYELITDSNKHKAFSGQSASISRKAGGKFICGDANGIVVDLKPAKRVVQAWRTKKFPEGIFSMAAFTLSRTSRGGTELILTHRGVPKEMIPQIEARWRKLYWRKMKDYLGE